MFLHFLHFQQDCGKGSFRSHTLLHLPTSKLQPPPQKKQDKKKQKKQDKTKQKLMNNCAYSKSKCHCGQIIITIIFIIIMIMMMVVTLLYGLISNIGSNMSSDGGVIGGGFIPTSKNPALWVDFQPTFGGL